MLAGAGWVYFLIPFWLRRIVAGCLGRLLYVLKVRRSVVFQNLELAYPSDSPGQRSLRDEICRTSYSHLGALALEILMLFGPMKKFVERFAELRGLEHWIEAKRAGKGVIVLSSHVGNWEVMAATGAVQAGIDIMMVTKHLKPEWLHRGVERGRLRCGVRATYEPRTVRDILAHLKNNGTIGFVLDQYAGPPVGVRVPVFGVPVSTTTAVAALVKRTGAVVLPVLNYRDTRGRFVVEIRPPAAWLESRDSSYELAANTAAYAAQLEKDIYAHPDQWLWIHRRFKGDLSPLRPGEWSEGRARK